jgi:hypothetical protein
VERLRPDVDAANFRLMIITSFLVAATMILLSLNVSVIRQSALGGQMGTAEWLLAASIVLFLFPSLVMLLMASVVLVSMYLAVFSYEEKTRIVGRARTLLGLASILIPTSFGSTFLVSLGLSSPWTWLFGAIGYGSGVSWALFRGFYLTRFVHPGQRKAQQQPKAQNALA